MNRAQCIDQLARQLLHVDPKYVSLEVWDKKHGYLSHAWVCEGINGYRFGCGAGRTLSDSLFLLLYSVAQKQEEICKWAWRVIDDNEAIAEAYAKKKAREEQVA